uniref:Uncharacterized protein n=1 Tax=Arundo donax TaxID=35708 RepID=A0A0A9CCA7_ARUDO
MGTGTAGCRIVFLVGCRFIVSRVCVHRTVLCWLRLCCAA